MRIFHLHPIKSIHFVRPSTFNQTPSPYESCKRTSNLRRASVTKIANNLSEWRIQVDREFIPIPNSESWFSKHESCENEPITEASMITKTTVSHSCSGKIKQHTF